MAVRVERAVGGAVGLRVSQEWGGPYRQFGALVFLEHSPRMRYVQVP